ncbi:putative membrane protein [Acetoanaerobium pronyense]|uniref:Membrane protein n=1 Tax=Acetoanaerobium pronyense TaxID=1482736 RepID=A0ABS4KHL7_9FIRM|nr:DUF2177 family protein [Acetoanaerobium pronyense]MBP2026751.1 putative membrane protein [Acetoanaerobium pronyense]
MYILKTYITTFAVFLVIDLIWLGFIARNLYKKYLGYLMAENVNWVAAIIFYMIFIAGILFFVINPAITKDSFIYAILAGACFGFITYSTYDLTNLATVRDWPLTIVFIDITWGTFLAASTSSISFLIIKKFFL